MALRLVFMGTPEFSVPCLDALVARGHEVAAVYSQPPRPAGRGMADRKSPVHVRAEALGIPVLTPRTLKSAEALCEFSGHAADAAVVVAYGLLLPRAVLDAPRHGCFNVHASALPRWRGAAPIHRAIMAGDAETAVMVMKMEEGLDTGPICATTRVPIGPLVTTGELHDILAAEGAALIVDAMDKLEAGQLPAVPQRAEGVAYAAKIDKKESRIDFSRPANEVHNHIRGLSPFPGAWFEATGPEGTLERIKVLRSEPAAGSGPAGSVLDDALTIACGAGAVRLIEVQRAGRKPMPAAEFLRGFPLAVGTTVKQT
ncbi:MAG: methionyl-tRNA formyltransferase [Hyphomicrobium sp.]|jgi:methionyl-tRNA formyltransferase|nr:methionyl-tRNA formyltransferase [Hyphomicrobium sp.]